MPGTNPNIVTETRRDRGELLSARVMPNGTLLVEGRIAKPGILEYIREDGSIQRELIRAEELFKKDSLRTLGRVPITLEHPPEDVTPRNVQRFGVGDVDGDIVIDDEGFVRIKMAVRREDAIIAIRKGKQELSPGYALRLDTTGGVHPKFGAFDAEQLDRVYNHARSRTWPAVATRSASTSTASMEFKCAEPTADHTESSIPTPPSSATCSNA